MSDKSCGWEGYAFGAHYPDAICGDGYLWDTDSCEEPGEPLLLGGDRVCPQCKGTGSAVDGERGPMAFYRQEAREEFDEWLEAVEEEDARTWLTTNIDALFRLVRQLEEPEQKGIGFNGKDVAALNNTGESER